MPALIPIKRAKFEKFLLFIGCKYKRSKGDHFIYDREDLKRPIVITADREVPVFIIRNNLRTLGLSVEEFLTILEEL